MTDIVERLRVNAWRSDGWNRQDAAEAASEIERLRNALREIAEDGPEIPLDEEGEGPNWPMHIYAMKWASFSTKLQTIAIIALKESDRD
jgi:hypothetical protein